MPKTLRQGGILLQDRYQIGMETKKYNPTRQIILETARQSTHAGFAGLTLPQTKTARSLG